MGKKRYISQCIQKCQHEKKRLESGKTPRLPVWKKISTLQYEKELKALQTELLKLQNHVKENGMKILIIFWYNRAGVEPVMGFCTEEEHARFLHEVPFYEEMIVGSGTHLIKFYLSVSKEEQAKRFEERRTNPLKHYKISPVDEKAQSLWDKYTIANSLGQIYHCKLLHAACIPYQIRPVDHRRLQLKKKSQTQCHPAYSLLC